MTFASLKSALILATVVALNLILLSPAQAEKASKSAFFELAMGQDRFVIKLRGTRAVKEARQMIRSKRQAFLFGQVVPAPAGYNRKWKFHVAPNSIQFVELAMEVCDAAPKLVQEHLAEVGESFLPGGIWCPWSSTLTKEVTR